MPPSPPPTPPALHLQVAVCSFRIQRLDGSIELQPALFMFFAPAATQVRMGLGFKG